MSEILRELQAAIKVQYTGGLEFDLTNEMIAALKTLLFIGVICFSIERLFTHKSEQKVLRVGFFTDIGYAFLSPITSALTRLLFIIPIAVFCLDYLGNDGKSLIGTLSGFGPIAEFADQGIFQSLIVFLIILLLADFLVYWTHRALHSGFLWYFHAIHHCTEDLDWMNTYRIHPVLILFIQPLRLLPILFLGFPGHLIIAAGVVQTIFGYLSHTNVNWTFGPLRNVFVNPQYHSWHHVTEAHEGGLHVNYAGIFIFWDQLFGTAFNPGGDEAELKLRKFGTTQDKVPTGLFSQFIFPFEIIYNKLTGNSAYGESQSPNSGLREGP